MTTRREAELTLIVRDLEDKLSALREGAVLCSDALKAGDKFSAGLLAQGLVARILESTKPGEKCVCGLDVGATHRQVAKYGVMCCPDRLAAAAKLTREDARERYQAWEAEYACETCHLVGGHDEDLHAEAELARDENRAWDRAEVES